MYEGRTTPTGLYNFAHSYWSSAVALEAADVDATHPDAPINYLYFHAIELYLKSYLRAQSMALSDLKGLGHKIRNLAAAAEERGLSLVDEDWAVVRMIPANYMASRYIVVGVFSRPSEEALWGTCLRLHDAIAKVMLDLGHTRRIQKPPWRTPDRR